VTLHVRLFGPFWAAWHGQHLPGLGPPRLQSLLAYLLLFHRHRPAPREHLAFTFFPDSGETEARASLRRDLYDLRHWLPPPDGHPWLLIDAGEVSINPQAAIWTDVWTFEDSLSRGEVELEAAARLVTADLLPHLYDDWLALERERLRTAYAHALSRLVSLCQSRGDCSRALAWAQWLVAHDPLREEAQRLLMALHYTSGDRGAALEQFEACRKLLWDELGVAPMPETLALRDAILRGEPLPSTQPAVATPAPIAIRTGTGAPQPPRAGEAMPFIGREAELGRLAEQWRRAAEGTGSLVLVGGEAGVGKSRLLHELAAQVQGAGGQVLWGHCYAFERSVPYQPAVEALRAALPQLISDNVAPLWLAEAARLVPELRQERPDLPEPARLEPEHEQARLMEGLCRCLLGLAERQPLLLLLEDLHWAADSTLTWLHALARQVHGTAVLVVGTYRQEEVGRGHPVRELMHELRREGWAATLDLHPLGGEAIQRLVQALSGLGEGAVELARSLQAESEGNPFFLSELLRHLEETGQLVQANGHWAGTWVEAGGSARVPLPESVREAIQARVERLSERGQNLLGCMAVAGREFDLGVVQAALGQAEEEAVAALDELLERGLVREGALITARDHAFNHHLVQETVYAGLPRARRQVWHRLVGEAMLSAYSETTAGELGYHFEQAAMYEQALHYLKLAGDQVEARYAHEEALHYYGRAVSLLRENHNPTEPALSAQLQESIGDIHDATAQHEQAKAAYHSALTALPGSDPIRQARLHRKVGDSYRDQDNYEEAARVYVTALTCLGAQAVEPIYTWWQEWVEIQLGLIWIYYYEARVSELINLAEQARSVVEQYGTPLQQTQFFQCLINANNLRDRYVVADETLTLARSTLRAAQSVGDPAAVGSATFGLGFSCLWHGDFDEAEEHIQHALAIAEQMGLMFQQTLFLTYLTVVQRKRGQVDMARQYAARSLAAATSSQLPLYTGVAHANLAWIAWREQHVAETEEHARIAHELLLKEAGYPFQWLALFPLLGVMLNRNDFAAATESARALLDPYQQRLPDELSQTLEEAIRAWDSCEPIMARSHLLKTAELARPGGYL
jgi:predicted ATPase/DNA-binding SARP family transcriptional activator